jgi:hypothetical protein
MFWALLLDGFAPIVRGAIAVLAPKSQALKITLSYIWLVFGRIDEHWRYLEYKYTGVAMTFAIRIFL